MPTFRLPSFIIAAGALALTLGGASNASDAQAEFASAELAEIHHARGCARQFDKAQRLDMEAFRDYDAETFRRLHHRDSIAVFPSGAKVIGIDAIMTAFGPHFANREALWSWVEVYRLVDGCKSAFILYETTYEIPSIGYRHRALTGVTYTHKGNRWLATSDQSTFLQPPALSGISE